MLIQSGPEDDEGDALLAIATQAGVPKHMKLGLVQMKDQERMDRYSHPQNHINRQAFVTLVALLANTLVHFALWFKLVSSRP